VARFRALLPLRGTDMRTFVTLALFLAVFPFSVRGADARDDRIAQDKRLLREAGVKTDGPGLLAFFRQHTTTQADAATIERLIRDLGSDRFSVREAALPRLASIGSRAISRLQQAEKSSDPEVAWRARDCLRQIRAGSSDALLAAAARLVAIHKPEGATRALLDYIPFAEQSYLAEAVREALAAVAVRGGKTDPLLVAALTDREPARRAAAAVALVRARAPDALPAVRKLLTDPDIHARLLVALALVAAREKEALPTLIALLDQLPVYETGEVEELLYTLAGEKAPTVTPGTTPEERRKYRVAWEGWYRDNQKGIDLAKAAEAARARNHTLVVLLDTGKVIDLDEGNRPRFQIDGLQFPLDAQYIPGDRVLVAEYQGGRVSERNRQGKVLWEKKVLQPLVAQRLPGGNTFIATATQFIEVDRTGKEVWSATPPIGGRVMKAERLRNGNIACIVMLGGSRFYEIDREGRQIRNFPVQLSTSGGRIDVLPNGNVVVPEKDNNRVVEYDSRGSLLWQAEFVEPIAAVRLRNGHILVTSYQSQKAVELDRKGKAVWEYRTDTRVTRAWRH
jgi:HEAT repeats/PQQ-like domain